MNEPSLTLKDLDALTAQIKEAGKEDDHDLSDEELHAFDPVHEELQEKMDRIRESKGIGR